MSTAFWAYSIWGAVFVGIVGIYVVAIFRRSRSARKPITRGRKGATPSQNASVVASTMDGGRGGAVSAIVVPRDPQQYAKTMAPKK